MPVRILCRQVDSIRTRLGAALLDLEELDERRRIARQRLHDAYMELSELLHRSPLSANGDEDVA